MPIIEEMRPPIKQATMVSLAFSPILIYELPSVKEVIEVPLLVQNAKYAR